MSVMTVKTGLDWPFLPCSVDGISMKVLSSDFRTLKLSGGLPGYIANIKLALGYSGDESRVTIVLAQFSSGIF